MPKIKKLQKSKKKTRKKKETKAVSEKTTKPSYYKTKNYKQNEIKIKKISKQPTEKKIYNIKDYIVYPKHGVGKIVSVDKAKIGNIDINFYKIFIEKEKLTLSILIILLSIYYTIIQIINFIGLWVQII